MAHSSETPAALKSRGGPRLAIFDPAAADPNSNSGLESGLTPDLTPSKAGRGSKGSRKSVATPESDFPLWQRSDGRWCRKIKGRVHYFGTDRQAALDEWLRVKDDLLAGRTPRPAGDGLTVGELVNQFLNAKRKRIDSGELTVRSWADYQRAGLLLAAAFGKSRLVEDLAADDFDRFRAQLAKDRGPVALGNDIQRLRVIFKFAVDNRLVSKPIGYGQNFAKPSRRVLRKARAERGSRIFEADELRQLIEAAPIPLKAMILLGINCGLGQSDVANLPKSAVDLDRGWLSYPRPKTGIDRRCKLWPETVQAIRDAIDVRPDPETTEDDALVFLTKYRRRWVRTSDKGVNVDGISQEFGKLLKASGINGQRGFYCLRRGFETIGGDSRDQVAVNHTMGHADASMAAVYRERIEDARLAAVVEHVRGWLWPRPEPKSRHKAAGKRARAT